MSILKFVVTQLVCSKPTVCLQCVIVPRCFGLTVQISVLVLIFLPMKPMIETSQLTWNLTLHLHPASPGLTAEFYCHLPSSQLCIT